MLGILALCVTGCTYRGQVRRNIYQGALSTPKINASVLVLTDKNIPQELLITDTDNSDFQSFRLETKDGIAAAVTDAMSTLFTQADSGSATRQAEYDFIAEVTLESGLTRNNCAGELARWAVRQEGLCTLVTLALRQPNGTRIAEAKASRWREFRTPGFASSVRWLNKHTLIFSPVLTPIYMQAAGRTLREHFEANLTESLEDITAELAQQRAAFSAKVQNKMPATAQNYVE